MNLFTLEPLHVFTVLFLLLAAGVLWRCARESARALGQAREMKALAESRWATAGSVYQAARRDREIAIAANAEACRRERNVQVDEHIVRELVEARDALDALRGYTPIVFEDGPRGWLLFVQEGFPLERLLPAARKPWTGWSHGQKGASA